MGFFYNPASSLAESLSWLMAVVPAIFIQTSCERSSYVVYLMLYVMVYIPSCLIPCYAGLLDPVNMLMVQSMLMLNLFLVGTVYHLPLLRVGHPVMNPVYFWAAIGTASLILYVLLFAYCGISFNLVALEDVYDVRSDYKQSLEQIGSLPSYALQWQSCVINVFLIGYGMVARKPLVLAAGLAGQLAIYSITGFKSVLFSGLLIAGLALLMRVDRRGYGPYITWLAACLVAASGAAYWWTGSPTLPGLTNRMLIMPGLLTGQYYDFFSRSPHTLLGDSILRWFVTYPYSLPIANVIGEQYYNSSNCGANANLWAYGYASFGTPGLFIFSILLALVMWFYDSLAEQCDPRISTFLAGTFAINIANSSLLTSLLNHGFLWASVLVYLYPHNQGGTNAVDDPRPSIARLHRASSLSDP
jgi:hypothetical protein